MLPNVGAIQLRLEKGHPEAVVARKLRIPRSMVRDVAQDDHWWWATVEEWLTGEDPPTPKAMAERLGRSETEIAMIARRVRPGSVPKEKCGRPPGPRPDLRRPVQVSAIVRYLDGAPLSQVGLQLGVSKQGAQFLLRRVAGELEEYIETRGEER